MSLTKNDLEFKPNGIKFGSKSEEKLSPRSFSIQFEMQYKSIFRSVYAPSRFGEVIPSNLNSFS